MTSENSPGVQVSVANLVSAACLMLISIVLNVVVLITLTDMKARTETKIEGLQETDKLLHQKDKSLDDYWNTFSREFDEWKVFTNTNVGDCHEP